MILHISVELHEELRSKAEAEGKDVDELAEETLRTALEDDAWQAMLTHALETGRGCGFTESDVPALVQQWRAERSR